jgi:hypothetical protein
VLGVGILRTLARFLIHERMLCAPFLFLEDCFFLFCKDFFEMNFAVFIMFMWNILVTYSS